MTRIIIKNLTPVISILEGDKNSPQSKDISAGSTVPTEPASLSMHPSLLSHVHRWDTECTDVAMVLKIKYLLISLSMVKSNTHVTPGLFYSPPFSPQSPTCSSLPTCLLTEGLDILKNIFLAQIIFF